MKIQDYFKSDFLGFWIDFFDVNSDFKNLELFKWMDFDNSWDRLFYYKWFKFVITKHEVRNYKYKILFNYKWINVFAYYEWKDLWWYIKSNNHFIFYWSLFYLREFSYDFVLDFIQDNLLFYSIRRFDLCLDLAKSISWFYANQFEIYTDISTKEIQTRSWKPWSIIFNKNTWKIQWIYFWEVRDSKNKNYLIRVYDKKEDIKQNNKDFLLPEYLLHKDVVRLEIEFRPNLAKNEELQNLRSDDYMLNLFKSYFKDITSLFDWLDTRLVKLWKHYEKINLSDVFVDDVYTERFLSMFRWYAKKMYEKWHCPTNYLINNWLCLDSTIEKINKHIQNNALDNFFYSLDETNNIK